MSSGFVIPAPNPPEGTGSTEITSAGVVSSFAGTPDGNKFLADDGTLKTPATSLWDLTVDEPGTALANWTAVSGSWSQTSDHLQQTDATAAYRALRLNAKVPTETALVAEFEARFPAGATAGARALLSLTSDGLLSSTNSPWMGIQNNAASGVYFQRGDQETMSSALAVSTATWYTVRASLSGMWATVTVNGTTTRTVRISIASGMGNADDLMFVTYGGPVHFRNLKVWRLKSPI
jgi:hypothetical protein